MFLRPYPKLLKDLTPLVIYRMSQSFKTSETENYFAEGDIIMAEQLNDVIILLDHDMSREDSKSSYDIVKKYGIRFKDIQIKDRRKLVKVVLESKLKGNEKIKTIMKLEKKESGRMRKIRRRWQRSRRLERK